MAKVDSLISADGSLTIDKFAIECGLSHVLNVLNVLKKFKGMLTPKVMAGPPPFININNLLLITSNYIITFLTIEFVTSPYMLIPVMYLV